MWFKEAKYAWFIVSFLWILGFLGSIGRVIVQYYQGPITDDIGITRTFLGYAWSASILIGSLCAPFGGWLTDKFGYKVTIVTGSLMGLASTGVILIFPHPVGYFIGFGILGGLAGIGASTSYVIVTQWFHHHRAKALMIISSSSSIGLALIPPLFVGNESWLTWMAAYRISMAIGIAFIILMILFVRERKKTEAEAVEASDPTKPDSKGAGILKPARSAGRANLRESLEALLAYIKNPVLMVVIFALFTCGFSMGTVEMHLMAIQQSAHVSHTMFVASLSLLGILELVGGFVFAALLDRMPRAFALSCLYLIRAVAFSILFAHLYLSPILFTLIFGATYLGAIPGGILVANESLKSKVIGLQTGVLLLFHQLGGGFAAIAGGLNYDLLHNYQILIAVNIVLSLISCLAYYAVRKSNKAERNLATASTA